MPRLVPLQPRLVVDDREAEVVSPDTDKQHQIRPTSGAMRASSCLPVCLRITAITEMQDCHLSLWV
jgi:hypothetical protein